MIRNDQREQRVPNIEKVRISQVPGHEPAAENHRKEDEEGKEVAEGKILSGQRVSEQRRDRERDGRADQRYGNGDAVRSQNRLDIPEQKRIGVQTEFSGNQIVSMHIDGLLVRKRHAQHDQDGKQTCKRDENK